MTVIPLCRVDAPRQHRVDGGIRRARASRCARAGDLRSRWVSVTAVNHGADRAPGAGADSHRSRCRRLALRGPECGRGCQSARGHAERCAVVCRPRAAKRRESGGRRHHAAGVNRFSALFRIALAPSTRIRRDAVLRVRKASPTRCSGLFAKKAILELAPFGVFALAVPLASKLGLAAAGLSGPMSAGGHADGLMAVVPRLIGGQQIARCPSIGRFTAARSGHHRDACSRRGMPPPRFVSITGTRGTGACGGARRDAYRRRDSTPSGAGLARPAAPTRGDRCRSRRIEARTLARHSRLRPVHSGRAACDDVSHAPACAVETLPIRGHRAPAMPTGYSRTTAISTVSVTTSPT